MFASNKPLKYSILLILFSALLCVSLSHAQQNPDGQDSNESRRIDRLGEGSTDEWEMDLSLPSAAKPAEPGMSELALPDEEQYQQL